MRSGYFVIVAAVFVTLPLAVANSVTLPLKSRRVHGALRTRNIKRSRGWRDVDVPLIDWINGTDLQWYTTITVGTPPQEFTVTLDTGSADLLLPRNNCTDCDGHRLFDPSRSSTFKPTPGEAVSFGFGTGVDQFPLPTYEGPNGTIVTDAVDLFGLRSLQQEWLLCDVDSILADGVPDGVLGISLVNVSYIGLYANKSLMPFYWNLYYSNQLESPKFSFFMNPGHECGGELTLGGVDELRYTGSITTVPLNHTESVENYGYFVDQSAIYVDGKMMYNASTGKPYNSALAQLDTGTAFIYPPDLQTTEALYAAISPDIKPIGTLGSWGASCEVLDSAAVDVTFQLGSRSEFNATIPKEFFNLGPFPGQTELCEAVFVAPDFPFTSTDGTLVWLLGSPLLKSYYTVWDGLNYEVGFATPISINDEK